MVAIPAAAVVERDQEQVPSIERLQHGLATALAGDGIAQRAAQPVQDGGLQQEAPDLFGLTLQDLLDQVVDDVAIVPGEALDEAGDVVSTLHRKRRQLECSDPPFGARLQRGDIARAEIQPHRLVEVCGGLVRGEAQICRADLGEFAPRPQASQRQRWVGAGGDHHVDLLGQMLDQELHSVMDLVRVDQVEVVEHQHDVVRARAELVEQRREDRLDRRWPRRLKKGKGGSSNLCRHRLQRTNHVGPEGRGSGVARVEGEPRSRRSTGRDGGQPLRQQRRLAEAGRRGDERQLRLGPPAQVLVQSRTYHQTASQLGDVELGFEQRGRHDPILWPTPLARARKEALRAGKRR